MILFPKRTLFKVNVILSGQGDSIASERHAVSHTKFKSCRQLADREIHISVWGKMGWVCLRKKNTVHLSLGFETFNPILVVSLCVSGTDLILHQPFLRYILLVLWQSDAIA